MHSDHELESRLVVYPELTAPMSKIIDFFSAAKYILVQQQKIKSLQAEVEKLRQQNDSMRTGMRRCVTCEYRIDFKKDQDQN